MYRITHKNLLWFEFGTDSKDQISRKLEQFICKVHKISKEKIKIYTSFHTNRPECYVWFVCSVSTINSILGLNKDGSERVKIVEDENWKPYTQEQIDETQKILNNTTSWGDMHELTEKLKVMKENKRPTIKVELPSLISNPFNLQKGWAKGVPLGYENGVLVSTKQTTIDAKDLALVKSKLYETFRPFNTSSDNKFPIVGISKNSKIYITYDINTDDSVIALCMLTGKKYTIIIRKKKYEFNFWYKKSS